MRDGWIRVCGSRSQVEDHGKRTVRRCAVQPSPLCPLLMPPPSGALLGRPTPLGGRKRAQRRPDPPNQPAPKQQQKAQPPITTTTHHYHTPPRFPANGALTTIPVAASLAMLGLWVKPCPYASRSGRKSSTNRYRTFFLPAAGDRARGGGPSSAVALAEFTVLVPLAVGGRA